MNPSTAEVETIVANILSYFSLNTSTAEVETIVANILSHYSLNPSTAEVETMVAEIDEDGSGEIEFNEFLKIMSSKTLR